MYDSDADEIVRLEYNRLVLSELWSCTIPDHKNSKDIM